jgi:hypothetical protein
LIRQYWNSGCMIPCQFLQASLFRMDGRSFTNP